MPESAVPVEINFSASLDQVQINRTVVTMLDFLGDIGGLFQALSAIAGSIVVVLSFNGLHQYITPNMYKVR